MNTSDQPYEDVPYYLDTENIFFHELLPACFERTLQIEESNLEGCTLEWLFTGAQGGFTVRLSDTTVQVVQRFYDSFGLHPLEKFFDQDPSVPLARWFEEDRGGLHLFPEKQWFQATAPCLEKVETLSVVLDHKMALVISVNGQEKISQTCIPDVRRHHLRWGDRQGSITVRLVKPEPTRATIRIDESRRFQTMIGFGGTAAPTAYIELSPKGKQRWWELVCEYNLLIQRENPVSRHLKPDLSNFDDLESAFPSYYGDCFPNFEISDFSYNKIIQSLGGQVFFEFWGLPDWMMKEGEGINDRGQHRDTVVDADEFARAMLGFCNQSVENAGAPPDVLGIQNESSQTLESYHGMTLTLRRELDRAGFQSVKIQMSDANMMSSDSVWGKVYSNSLARARAFTSNPEAWAAIDYSATHMYDYQEYFNRPDDCDQYLREFKELTADKPFFSSEMCVNNPRYQLPTYRVALLMAELYHKNFAIADAVGMAYCYTLVNIEQPSFGWTRSLLVADTERNYVPRAASHQLRVFGAYSRRIKAGMVRVAAETGTEDLMVTAYVGDDDQRTVVILNRSSVPRRVSIEGLDGGFTHMEIADPYHENEVLELDAQSGEVEVDPGAIVTLTTVPLGALPEGFTLD